jgi:lysophospholipase
VLSRSLYRTNTEVPEACTKCFDKYCWNGDIDQGPLKQFVPAMKLEDERIDVASAAAERLGGVVFAVVVAVVLGVVNLA